MLPIVGELDDLVLLGMLLTELAQMALGDPFRPQPSFKSPPQTDASSASNPTLDIQATTLETDP